MGPVIRVLGVGSPAGDDGVGLEVARRLAARPPDGVEVRAVDRRGAELLELLDGADSVIVIDAARSGAPLGTVHELPLAALPRDPSAPLSSHGVGVQAALALADALGRRLPPGVVLAIEGGDRAAMSPAVAEAIDAVVARVRGIVAGGTAPRRRRRFAVAGTVQAVGFRPAMFRLASDLGLAGRIANTPSGVLLDLEGDSTALDAFAARLRDAAPPAARLDAVTVAELPASGTATLTIAPTTAGTPRTQLPPDLATCADCLAEILDPAARRFRYPFTNCTRCGPRFTVVTRLPYDRAAHDAGGLPAVRRLRARARRSGRPPLPCRAHRLPALRSALLARRSRRAAGDPIATAAALLRDGAVLAVQGVGGVHLACDATNDAAVARLRAVKRRPHKPLAVMVASLADAARLAALERRGAGPARLGRRADRARRAASRCDAGRRRSPPASIASASCSPTARCTISSCARPVGRW